MVGEQIDGFEIKTIKHGYSSILTWGKQGAKDGKGIDWGRSSPTQGIKSQACSRLLDASFEAIRAVASVEWAYQTDKGAIRATRESWNEKKAPSIMHRGAGVVSISQRERTQGDQRSGGTVAEACRHSRTQSTAQGGEQGIQINWIRGLRLRSLSWVKLPRIQPHLWEAPFHSAGSKDGKRALGSYQAISWKQWRFPRTENS